MIAIVCGVVLVGVTILFWTLAMITNNGIALAFGSMALVLFLAVTWFANRKEES